MTFLHIELFNGLHIQRNGESVTLAYDKVRALFAYLVLESARPLRRDTLTALLWPDQSDKEARHNLSQALLKLRQALDPNGILLLSDRHTVQLNPAIAVEVDVVRFESHLHNCQSHPHARTVVCDVCMDAREAAVKLYQGDFLAGISIPDAPEFEDWLVIWRERLHQQAIDALDALTAYHERRGEVAAALDYAREQIRLEPWREEAHRQAMRLLLYNGQRSAALAQYQRCVQILADEFGVPPAPETEALFQLIQTTDAQPPHNLPPQATPFLGRQTELAELSSFIANPDYRLLTLVGPGGIGKTRLALAVAERQLGRPTVQFNNNAPNVGFFAHGVYWVSLVGLETAVGLIPIIANTLGLQLESGSHASRGRSAQQQLLDYLREKRLLILLDNFEQFLTKEEATAATAVVRAILQEAPQVQLLVTSRERLQLREEQLYQLHGLDYPEGEVGEIADVEMERKEQEVVDMTSYASVALFTQIARHIQPDFLCNGPAARTVVQICQKLRGMPLAIELAAASINVLSTTEILAELRHSLDVLSTTTRHIPARHRSIRAAFETSWHQLSLDEQTTFQKLCVFRGGFTREAAQTVADASRLVLAELVNKSFIRFRPETQRYEIHELMRQFGVEQLDSAADIAELARQHHSMYYCAFLYDRGEALKGENQQTALAEIELDLENARIGWRWAVDHADWADVARGMDGLCRFYEWRGRLTEGIESCEYVIAHLDKRTSPLKDETDDTPINLLWAKSWRWRGVFHWILGEDAQAKQYLEQSLLQLESVNSKSKVTLLEKAIVLRYSADYRIEKNHHRARRWLEQSLDICKALDEQWEWANVLDSLARHAEHRASYLEARRLYNESLLIREQLNDRRGTATTLNWLGVLAGYEGKYEESVRLLRQCEATYTALGDQVESHHAIFNLATALFWQGGYRESVALMQESLPVSRRLGTMHYTIFITANLTVGLVMLGQYEEAQTHISRHLKAIQESKNKHAIGNFYASTAALVHIQHRYLEAKDWFEKSVTIYQEIGLFMVQHMVLAFSNYTLIKLGHFVQVRKQISQILQLAIENQVFLPVATVLPSIALFHSQNNAKEQAIELYSLALQYPYVANAVWFDDVVGKPIQAVAETLPPEVVAAAQERGRKRDFWETAAELLKQFSEEQD